MVCGSMWSLAKMQLNVITMLVITFLVLTTKGNLAQNDYTDFLISVFCPEDWGSMAEETIDCGPGAVIDIVSARVTLLTFNSLCEKTFDFIVDRIISVHRGPCNVELPFLLCHGNQKCIVDRSMANESLPDCDISGYVGFQSNILYVRYKCFKFENRNAIQLPSSRSLTGITIDILSPIFLINSNPVNDMFCKISPIKDNENVSLLINIKLVNYPPQIRSENVSVVLLRSEEDIVDLIPFNGAFEVRNKEYQVSGKEWTLQFHGGSEFEVGKFWIQIEGTNKSNDAILLSTMCESQIITTITMNTTASDEDSIGLIVGVTVGAVLFIILITVAIVVSVFIRRKRKKTTSPTARDVSVGNTQRTGSAENAEETPDYLVPVAPSINPVHGLNPPSSREYENVPNVEIDHDYDDVEKQRVPSADYINVREELSERRPNLSGNYESLNTKCQETYEELDVNMNRNGNI